MVSVIEGFHCNMIMKPKIIELLTHQVFSFHRLQLRENLTPLQATDPGGTITMVTTSGRSFTRQIKTEDTAVQETNPATLGQLVLGNWSIITYFLLFKVGATWCYHAWCFARILDSNKLWFYIHCTHTYVMRTTTCLKFLTMCLPSLCHITITNLISWYVSDFQADITIT